MEPLLGKTKEELQAIVEKISLPRFVAGQIADWLYKKKVETIDEMTNLSLKAREQLSQSYVVGRSAPVEVQESADGTVKYLFQTRPNHFVEAVFIPEKDRATLCVSSQVGCKMNCGFCMTGKMGFKSQLTAAEILNQVFSIAESDDLTNIVFMGMGEPLDNTDAVLRSTAALTASWGLAWSPKRITVSTIGVEKGLKRFLTESSCHLAVSLHNPFPDQRLEVMPVEKVFPIDRLITLLRQHDFAHQRRLSFEYILFAGWNDTPQHARQLVQLLKGLPCRVNLIRFHEVSGVPFRSADEATLVKFRDALNAHGVVATIRASRGEDILAACGQLSTLNSSRKIADQSKEI